MLKNRGECVLLCPKVLSLALLIWSSVFSKLDNKKIVWIYRNPMYISYKGIISYRMFGDLISRDGYTERERQGEMKLQKIAPAQSTNREQYIKCLIINSTFRSYILLWRWKAYRRKQPPLILKYFLLVTKTWVHLTIEMLTTLFEDLCDSMNVLYCNVSVILVS